MHGKHVFISYCLENQSAAAHLREELVSEGEGVWWDQDILPGQDWRLEIRQALRNAYAVILCLSKEVDQRNRSGIFAEAHEAIRICREHTPGNVFLIPVRFSECEIPSIEIDATRTLDHIQHVDLFPEKNRAQGIERLIAALQIAPEHPNNESLDAG